MPQIRIAEIIDDFDVGRVELVSSLKRLHSLRHLAHTEIIQPALIGGARPLVHTGLYVPVQGKCFDLALHGQDSLGVAAPPSAIAERISCRTASSPVASAGGAATGGAGREAPGTWASRRWGLMGASAMTG